MTPWLDDGDVRLYHGDALDVLQGLPTGTVHMCATSPPFYGLRDYGTGEWEGGDPACDHQPRRWDGPKQTQGAQSGHASKADRLGRTECRCGARRVDQQIGLEETPDQWVDRLVAVFREVKRVLRDDGVLFIEIGDSYAHGQPGGGSVFDNGRTDGRQSYEKDKPGGRIKASTLGPGLKQKDLIGQPWLLAFALRQPYYTGRITDERDRAWLAAIIDGEGAIALNRLRAREGKTSRDTRRSDYFGPYLRVHNTCEAIVRRCAEITGVGSVKIHDERRRPVWVWATYGAEAREILREVYPHLVAKQHEARLAYSGGDQASYEALKAIHQGGAPDVDQPAPHSCFEPGWYLRSEIIWARPNPMPESVTDRPTKSHSTVFLLSKRPRYFFDADAIRSPHQHDGRKVDHVKGTEMSAQHRDGPRWPDNGGANARSVWNIATEPTPFAHFATWPQALVRRMILAGTSERGACPECGAPWARETASELVDVPGGSRNGTETNTKADADPHARANRRGALNVTTLGWSPSCTHDHAPVPATVLDVFAGSGTTCLVARNHGRHSIGIELNQSYLEIAAKRLQQLSLLSETYPAPAEDGESHRKETEQSAF